jgi:hypothetical protein
MNNLFGSAKKRRKGSGPVVGADGDHHRKNTEDKPRGVVFGHDLIGGERLENRELDGAS